MEGLWIIGLVIGVPVVWFIYVVFIKEKLLQEKSIASKAASVIKKDMSSNCARCTFYAFNDYENGYTQAEWIKFYNERTKNDTLDKNSQEYIEAVAPIINAIVVSENDFYVRRGLENLNHALQGFEPGVNDDITFKYFVEPYEYIKDEENAAKYAQAKAQAKTIVVKDTSMENKLSAEEKREIDRAERNYQRAASYATSHPNSEISAIEEKQAYAEYMRVLAKYAGKK